MIGLIGLEKMAYNKISSMCKQQLEY